MITRFLVIMVCGEVILTITFRLVSYLLKNKPNPFSFKSVLKGILERLVMFFSLVQGFENIIMFFAAIKLGTRFKQDDETRVSNEFFLIGNLISVGAVILYYYLYGSDFLPFIR